MMVTNYLIVGAILFCLGAVGFLARRNMIVMFLGVEMMLQGVSMNLVAFSNAWGNWHGQVFALFVVTVAAAEAGIALALVLVLFRHCGSLDVSLWQELREPDQPAMPKTFMVWILPVHSTNTGAKPPPGVRKLVVWPWYKRAATSWMRPA